MIAPEPKPLRLAYLVPEFPGQTHAFFWREVTALRAAGVQARLFSTRRPSPDACRHAFADAARGETTYLAPPAIGPALAGLARAAHRIPAAAGYLAGLRETPALQRARLAGLIPCAAMLSRELRAWSAHHLHVHSCADAAHLAALTRILGGPPYSLTLHGDLPVYGVDHAAKCAAAAFVVAVTSPLHRDLVGKVGLDPSRVPVITMGVDTDHFAPDPARPARSGPLRLLTVARLNAAKGHVHALRALKRALDAGVSAQYEIAGEGPNRGAIEDEIRALGLDNHARLLGSLAEDAVRARLRDVDVFILPSTGLGEAAPVSVMEAMSCGLPVICSIIGGTRDMIDDGVDSYLVEKGDEAAIAERIVGLARDPDLRRRVGAGARARAVRQFDYRAAAALLKARIESSCSGPA